MEISIKNLVKLYLALTRQEGTATLESDRSA